MNFYKNAETFDNRHIDGYFDKRRINKWHLKKNF